MKKIMTGIFVPTVVLISFAANAQPDGRRCPPPGDGPIRLIVPFIAGGPTDLIARSIEHVIIENRPGAAGTVGASLVARSAPDGRTLLLTTVNGMAFTNLLYRNPPFDPVKDFVAISPIAETPMVMVTNPSIQARNMQELMAYTRQNPDRLNIATASPGSVDDLAGAMFAQIANLRLKRVPYKGTAPAIQDTIAGNTQIAITPFAAVRDHVRAGRLRALAVLSRSRSSVDPSVPTAQEAGASGLEVSNWVGLFAPPGTPPDRVSCYRDSSNQYYRKPEVLERFRSLGVEMPTMDPNQFPAYLQSEVQKWTRVGRDAGIRPE